MGKCAHKILKIFLTSVTKLELRNELMGKCAHKILKIFLTSVNERNCSRWNSLVGS